MFLTIHEPAFYRRNTLVDGSVAILIPKTDIEITENDLGYYNSQRVGCILSNCKKLWHAIS